MAHKFEDLTGQKFNLLTVLKRSENKKPNKVLWVCRCDCGNLTEVDSWSLKNSRTKSCGCLRRKTEDLSGKRFYHLTVIEQNKEEEYLNRKPGHNSSYWICRCDCGNYTTVRADRLKSGITKSCGCIKSFEEEKISQILTESNINFIREYKFNDLRGDKYPLKFDFAIFSLDNKLSCLIEYQGEQHYQQTFYDDIEDFEKRKLYDNRKREYCRLNNIPLIEISYKDKSQINAEYLLKLIKEVIV